MTTYNLTCRKCGKDFQTPNQYKKNCYECGLDKKTLRCQNCGKELEQTTKHPSYRKFCYTCRAKTSKKVKEITPRECLSCGKTFTPTEKQRYRIVITCPDCVKKRVWAR
jgi:DNA-directed RNA polymerase subunit RPC12/RpoP